MSLETVVQNRVRARSRTFTAWRTRTLRETHAVLQNGWLRNELCTILKSR